MVLIVTIEKENTIFVDAVIVVVVVVLVVAFCRRKVATTIVTKPT